MLERGFAATTVDDVCVKAKLTKGAFFHYFKSKEDLGAALIERWSSERKASHAKFFGNRPDPLLRVRDYADAIAGSAKKGALLKGCLLGNFSLELQSVPSIRKACERGFAEWIEQLAREIGAAKQRHAPKARVSPEELAEHFIALIEGAIIMTKASGDARPVLRATERFKMLLEAALQG